jgi:zinc transporter 1/2/3
MTIVVLFFMELMVMRYARFGQNDQPDVEHPRSGHFDDENVTPGEGNRDAEIFEKPMDVEEYMAQLTAIFILEFGIVFHSVFIGLTLAVSGEEFTTLYIVIVFHQTFEGLGLGSRLATLPWPPSKSLTPYILAIVYGVSTPIAIAIGLGVRKSYPPTGRTTLIVNGVFDSISGGILIYVGLVELMAREFMFTPAMQRAPIKTVLAAFLLLCCGAALMALLGKWA